MSSTIPLYDLEPVATLALIGIALALVPLAWVMVRTRGQGLAARRKALTVLTLFLTFDLVLFGAFTRLTDSGLGCPDWPGCYGSASPIGAQADIHAAETAMPFGPVTRGKAWIEMVHRYLATGIGVLATVLMAFAWWQRWRKAPDHGAWWSTFTWFWVCLQGAFGAWTVTMKLYPAIVTGHLLGGLGLVMLLGAQSQHLMPRPLPLPSRVQWLAIAALVLTVAQALLGGWVSTNYAVLACREFPTCNAGQWWPPMDFEHGFAVFRHLGVGRDGGPLPFEALVAIHMVHRIGALVLVAVLAALLWQLVATRAAAPRRWAMALGTALVWQLCSGMANVVLGWPIVAALAHTGGAAALVTLLAILITRARQAHRPAP